MKKNKIAMLSLAVLLAIFGAYAHNNSAKNCKVEQADGTFKYVDCTAWPQYYRFHNNTYLKAGEVGLDYTRETTVGACAYYRPASDSPPNFYSPCRTGVYFATY